jgi:beta-mannanase
MFRIFSSPRRIVRHTRRLSVSVAAITAVALAILLASMNVAAAGTTAYATANTTAKTTPTTIKAPRSGGSSNSVLWGAATPDLPTLQSFNSDAGKPASLYLFYNGFANNASFDASQATAIQSLGATPFLAWEPWDATNGTVDQPAYSLANIASGAFDTYISTWAQEIKAWGQPLWLEFAPEMNGNWYPWGNAVNGNTPAEYIAAYRHVHDLFTDAGVTNVVWVWTTNVTSNGSTPIGDFYPGDAYVNFLGVDGYNWGTTQSWGSVWQTPTQVFNQTLVDLEQLSTRPIVIAETASTEQGGNKAQWIRQFFSMMAATPVIKAFVWFNFNKETDWQIESSSTARAAFAAGVANSRYLPG